MSQQALNHRRVVDEGNEVEASPTQGTGERIQAETPAPASGTEVPEKALRMLSRSVMLDGLWGDRWNSWCGKWS